MHMHMHMHMRHRAPDNTARARATPLVGSTLRYRAPECLLTDGFYNYKMDM